MVKSMYAFVREAWKKPDKSDVEDLLWERMQVWRREGSDIVITALQEIAPQLSL